MEVFEEVHDPLNLISITEPSDANTVEEHMIDNLSSSEANFIAAADNNKGSTVPGQDEDLFAIEMTPSTSGDISESVVDEQHVCYEFRERLYQYLGDGGQVFNTTGYECLGCKQLYTKDQLQKLAQDRNETQSSIGESSTTDVNQGTAFINMADATGVLESDISQVMNPSIEQMMSLEMEETKYLIGQPRVAGALPMVTSNITDAKLNEVEKQLKTTATEPLTSTSHLYSHHDNPVTEATSVEVDESAQNICENIVPHLSENALEINEIDKYFEDVENNYEVTASGEIDTNVNSAVIDSEKVIEFIHRSNMMNNERVSAVNVARLGHAASGGNISGTVSGSDTCDVIAPASENCTPASGGVLPTQPLCEAISQTVKVKEEKLEESPVENSAESHPTSKDEDTPVCEQSPHILVTFSSKKNETKRKLGFDEGDSRDEVTQGSGDGNMTHSQQVALDKLIVELENASKKKDSQQTQVFYIENLDSKEKAVKSEEKNSDDFTKQKVALKSKLTDASAVNRTTEISEGVRPTGGNGQPQGESDEDEAVEPLEDKSEEEEADISEKTKTEVNELFEAVDNTKCYMNLYEQAQEKGMLEAVNVASEKDPVDRIINADSNTDQVEKHPTFNNQQMNSTQQESVRTSLVNTTVGGNSEVATDNHKRKVMATQIGRSVYVKDRATCFLCSQCKLIFETPAMLEKHFMKRHCSTDKDVVGDSGQSEDTTAPVTKKIKTDLEEVTTYQCHCKARFVTQESLAVHMSATKHGQVYTCHLCDREFSSISALNGHKVVHTNAYKVREKGGSKRAIYLPVDMPVTSRVNSKQSATVTPTVVTRKLVYDMDNVAGADSVAVPQQNTSTSNAPQSQNQSTSDRGTTVQPLTTIDVISEDSHSFAAAADLHQRGALLEQATIGSAGSLGGRTLNPSHKSTQNAGFEDKTSSNNRIVSDAVMLDDDSCLVEGVKHFPGKPPPKPLNTSHIERDILAITCIRCNKSYSCKEQWTYSGTLQCTACRWNFESPAHLQCHYDHFHMYSRDCPFCKFACTRGSATVLDKHFKAEHPDKDIFHCYLCEATFTTRACLRNHVTRHFSQTGEFECPHCHMRFEREQRLNVHKVRNHRKLLGFPTGEINKPETATLYMCGICGRQYEYEGTLKMHLKKHQVEHEDNIPTT